MSPVVPACIPQDHLEPVLRDHLVEQAGTIRFATELTNLAVGPTGVDAKLTRPEERPPIPRPPSLRRRRRRSLERCPLRHGNPGG